MLHYRLHQDPKSSHQQIARLLRQRRPRLILDVGAAQGMLGQVLQDSGLIIDAIEPEPGWAEHARRFYRTVHNCTVEEAKLAERYDAVICADVLEHTASPAGVLRQLRQVAMDDALFVISVPNVAHLAVRLMLLAGYFPKMERGILDRTHLHFFTRDTARQLLESAGLKIERVFATGVPLDELWRRRGRGGAVYSAAMRMQHAAVAVWPRMFGFQWIFAARNQP
jgi:2-polyprenyl-3-methyl-5-hydroxy-6-metoxy-1,4-benzoquinol methylase